jgi:CRISPR-associated endonuclease Csn1
MSAKQKMQKMQTVESARARADLQLAFDVGHSSIGWAVLQTVGHMPTPPETPDINILGCGVVTFPADDCLASKRRDYRRQRRHTRSTRKRIERMEKLLAHLNIFMPEHLRGKHRQAGGHSVPWLLAARVLAARTEKEREKAKLTSEELWDVLRWYAHNRGYDANIRYSGEYKVEVFSNIPQVTKAYPFS